jgi:hypothetical protein
MTKPPKRKNLRPPGKCLFCGGGAVPGNPMTKEHIWSDWVQKILPRLPSRTEGHSGKNVKHFQGDVGTKKVRVVCRECNGGWMRNIVDAAKPYAKKLIDGDTFQLDLTGQRALTNWIALSALMANRITKSRHQIPPDDIAYFYARHEAPPHWFVGIGHFVGLRGLSFNHSAFALVGRDTRDGSESIMFVKHSFATILGNLFTLVDANVGLDHPLAKIPAGSAYLPNIVSLQPNAFPQIPFPGPDICIIHGPEHFWPGTHAYGIGRRATDALEAIHRAMGVSDFRS